MRKPRQADAFWFLLATAFGTSLFFLATDRTVPSLEIIGVDWTQGEETVKVTASIVNRSAMGKVVTIEFVLDLYADADSDPSVSFYGRMERAFEVAPQETLPIEASIPVVRRTECPVHVDARITKAIDRVNL